MTHVCETTDHLIIATENNKIIFINDSLEPTTIIQVDDVIRSVDIVKNEQLLLVGTQRGIIKMYQIARVIQGVT